MKTRIWTRGFILIFIINILTATSFSMMLPTLPKYVMSLGFSSTITGLISTTFVVTSVLIRPWTGFLADNGNIKKILMVSLSIICLSALGYSISKTAAFIVIFRLVHGIGWGLVTTAVSTYATLCLPEDKLGRGIGIFGLASVIASSYAPNLGLQISDSKGYPLMFCVAAGLCIVGILLTFLLPPLNRPKKEKPENAAEGAEKFHFSLKNFVSREALLPSLMVLLLVASTSSIGTFVAIYAGKLNIQNIGLFFTVDALVLLVSRPLSGWLSDSLRKEFVVYPCILLVCASLVLISIGRSLPTFLAAAVCYGLGYGGMQPMLQAWAVKNAGKLKSGAANSTFYIGLDVGTGIGASISGAIADLVGYSSMYLVMMIPTLLGGVVFTLALISGLKKKRKTEV